MPAVTGRNLEQVTNASKLLANKFASIKSNKPVLTFIDAQLDIYFTNTPNGEDFADCYEFLSNKAKDLLAADDADLLKNLM
jgi:ssDNA-specific exonuclease RecJ